MNYTETHRSASVNWNGYGRFLFLMIALVLVVLLGPANQPQLTNVQPALLAMAAEQPDTAVRVIIQKNNADANLQESIDHLGGRIVQDLPFIQAVAAELPAKTVLDLAAMPNVNWVGLDRALMSSQVDTTTVRDTFDQESYGNNNGSANWATNWTESNDDGNPSNGNIEITQNQLMLRDDNRSIKRSANLADAGTAVLSFDYRRYSFDNSSDYVAVQISTNAGASWTELGRFAGPASDRNLQTVSYDIAGYIPNNIIIRFATSGSLSRYDRFYIDNVQIKATVAAATNTPTPNHYLNTTNVQPVWDMGLQGQGIAVAVIDSGISPSLDFGDRLVAQVSFNADAESLNDSNGHGTHIAGIIGGNGANSNGLYTGIAPQVNLIGLKVSDESGMAYESDTVAAMQWVLENKDVYNIRVVNISLNSTVEQSYHTSPFDLASELLWFNGVVVVASAGNGSLDGNFYTINASPANDPYIITVGASTEADTDDPADDNIALFSAHGTTVNGFVKPDIIAPGYNIVSVLSADSSWDTAFPDRVEGSDYFRLSGTSMAAPIVSGAAALLLQDEPNLTPDQVKYRLMNAANKIVPIWLDAIMDKTVYPYLDVYTAVNSPTTESANEDVMPHMALAQMALIAYWANQNDAETIDWSAVDWSSVNWDNVDWDAVDWDAVDWDSVNWGSVNWGSVNWGSVNWGSVNWGSVNWGSVNWGSVNWGSVSWGSVSWDN
jgi:serine protease AprX